MQFLENRILSATEGTRDVSVLGRIYEYEGILKKIYEFPMGGNGLQKNYTFYNPLSQATISTNYSHNGYFYNTYRVGIPLFLFYLIPLLYYFGKGFKLLLREKDLLNKPMLLVSLFSFITLFTSNLAANIFGGRDAQFIMAFSMLFVSLVEHHQLRNKINT